VTQPITLQVYDFFTDNPINPEHQDHQIHKKKKTEPAQDSSKPLKKKKQSNCEKVQTFLSSDRCDNGCFLAIAAVGDDMELK
jgi:hypothetical protein